MWDNTVSSLLGFAFAAWAGVVAWGVHRVTSQVDGLAADLRALMETQNREIRRLEEYTHAVEHRTVVLEHRDQQMLAALQVGAKPA